MDKREITCCFTGHRVIARAHAGILRQATREAISGLYARGVRYFGAGGALGFDTLAAREALALRAGECPELRLILVLPCLNQADRWSLADREIYREIMHAADKVVYTADRYTDGCMQKRNRYLVDGSRYCIAYLNRDFGGTAYTVRYAIESGLEVKFLP